MFERFTKDARAVVTGAVEHAEKGGARTIDPEHLLLSLIDREDGRASSALAALADRRRLDSVREALVEARRHAGLSQSETEALAGLGIDVAEVVARVEETHGVGAMSGDRAPKGRRSGHRPLDQGTKDVLERSLRIAVARKDRHIGDEHILLALTARPGVPAEVLADHGVTYTSVTRALYGDGESKKAG
ncbi:hypothetical protein SZN_02847 [Streptomyces zinciresistens K42]|uniref:Clp R domain-containing protein n=1 Tax=Streptomyces zinciresistens K42 TaxID=700597 RepID=G2G516_9ACTN|nr:Clp protease N-terminal domain-containing protein [Streptomyces zinciresistens]EGX61454.1 hypothetical protein SZN_02847 [Streptomyces zinciresistens K42]